MVDLILSCFVGELVLHSPLVILLPLLSSTESFKQDLISSADSFGFTLHIPKLMVS